MNEGFEIALSLFLEVKLIRCNQGQIWFLGFIYRQKDPYVYNNDWQEIIFSILITSVKWNLQIKMLSVRNYSYTIF